MRRAGAVPVGSGVWACPDLPIFVDSVPAIRDQARRGAGSVAVFTVVGYGSSDTALFRDAFVAAREAEWAQLLTDIEELDASVAVETGAGERSISLVERLDRNLQQLRRRQRALQYRDVLRLSAALTAARALEVCGDRLHAYADDVRTMLLSPGATS